MVIRGSTRGVTAVRADGAYRAEVLAWAADQPSLDVTNSGHEPGFGENEAVILLGFRLLRTFGEGCPKGLVI